MRYPRPSMSALIMVLAIFAGLQAMRPFQVPAAEQKPTQAPEQREATQPTGQQDTTKATEAKDAQQTRIPVVVMETSEGAIKIELWPDKAPATVANFLRYTDEGFYSGTIFHRVIANFMIQGGGFTSKMERKEPHDPIKNEARTDTKNLRGTIAMARTNVIDSASSQFFINTKDNPALDHRDNSSTGFGYAVFGKVVEGMDVVDKIGGVQTTSVGPHSNVPAKPVLINKVSRAKVE